MTTTMKIANGMVLMMVMMMRITPKQDEDNVKKGQFHLFVYLALYGSNVYKYVTM